MTTRNSFTQAVRAKAPLQRVGAELTAYRLLFGATKQQRNSVRVALDRLPPPAFTAYGLQSVIQHVAHFPMGSGTAC
jgi:hypothetical protein